MTQTQTQASQSQDKLTAHSTMSVAPVNPNRHIAMQVDRDSSTKPYKTNRCRPFCICCGVFVTLIFILAIILIVITFTLYKVRDPSMIMNTVQVSNFTAADGTITPNVMVRATALITNPNALSVDFNSSTSAIYYNGKKVSHTVGPGGVAPAKHTIKMNATFDIKTEDLMNDMKFLKEFIGGFVGFGTSTFVAGKVTAFGVVHKGVDIMFNCTVMIDMSTLSMKNSTCGQHIKLL